ncbi:carbohydrate kinase family protein [Candidatus Xianfuyuplasma coldseepsis]|uniref:Carbohydrate kinase family protein n=1 Tax=Candidatus Xianfuyuplasma coldseepsis TaxID=2782163 RepID=A0A7L7KRU1_9MOLU|nr:carbohydrate kinase family protein [Xianfuyuplasma coldseepsis]QMS84916.1 carbohydrate kinase family protein [Xianfuyuplasma coldseepsis]
MKSLVIGGCSVDTLIHVPEINSIADDMSLWATNVSTNIGGTGAGKALALDVLSSKVTLITDLGNDEYRPIIESFFETTTIHVVPVETDKCTAHTNIMHSQGKRISIFTSVGTQIPPIPHEFYDIITTVDVVFLNINEFCRQYIPFLQNIDIPIVVDIHDYDEGNPYHQDFIDVADILIASGVSIPNHGQFLKKYIELGKEFVVITNGSKGLVAMDHKQVFELKGYTDFTYVDSNGAGDSFVAGMMIKYLETNDIKQSLVFGSICGAMSCTSYDLYNKKYTKEVIEKIVKGVSL